jgi:hypothetical protein
VSASQCDPGGDLNHPIPSGIYKIDLKNTDTGAAISPLPQIAAGGENPSERTFSNLAEGHYQINVLDGLGNSTTSSFTRNRVPLIGE